MNRKTFLKCGFWSLASVPTLYAKPKESEYDVIVIGGGPSGMAAAIASAESGAKTLLVEEFGELGGTGGPGCVNHWLGGRTVDCKEYVVGGIFRRIVAGAVAEGIALEPKPEPDGSFSPHGWGRKSHLTAGIPFDGSRMSEFLDRQCIKAGVELLFLTRFVGCKSENGLISEITLHNRSGFFSVKAARFIDASGDAWLAAAAGVPFEIGREADGKMTPASLEFHVSGVDTAKLSAYINLKNAPRFLSEISDLSKRGIWKFPYNRFISVQLAPPDTFMINTSRLIGINGLDGESVSECMIRGRSESVRLFAIMQKHFPGFENARISRIASMPGIRETRRIKGSFFLCVDDIVGNKKFEDTIGFCCYGWDLPDPTRPSYQPMSEKKVAIRGMIPLPFRIMEPQKVSNLLCPGRSVSVEREVLGAVRVMASCMAMGEAAGVASATGLRGVSLRDALRKRGCIVDDLKRKG